MKRGHIAGIVVLGLITGCAGLIGVPDLTFDEKATQGTPDGSVDNDGSSGGIDGSSGGADSTTATDSGTDGPAPPCDETKLQTSGDHCGRCGHSCLGGECKAGKCQPVIVQGGLTNPTDLVADAQNLYVSCRGGEILRISKTGGQPQVLATNQTKATGVALNGTTLFWSNLDFNGDGGTAGGGDWGGVWKCTLPGCSPHVLVTEANFAANVRFSNNRLYFAEANNSAVIAVNPDGSNRIEIANPTQPYTVSVDAQHVYFVANSPTFQRVQLDGGNNENVGPLDVGGLLGQTVVDTDRVYWAFGEYSTPKGHVYSALKSNPALPKIEYGTDNVGSNGVTVDATNVYWTNEGTFVTNIGYSKDGDVRTCPKAGCAGAPIVLGSGIQSPGAIIADGDAIYFVSFGTKVATVDGTIYRVAKP